MKFLFRYVIVYVYLYVWSPIYRWLLERGERNPLRPYNSFESLLSDLQMVGWKSDDLYQLWDAIGHPERMRWMIDSGVTYEHGVDCDEHSVYCAESLRISEIDGLEEVVGVLTVSWRKDGGGFGGHHVCLLRYKGRYAHISNWGLYTGFVSQTAAMLDVLNGRRLIGWFLWEFPHNIFQLKTKIE